MTDVIVVGSGASGVHAAVPLVRAGLRVTLVDVGFDNPEMRERIPEDDFQTIRRSDHGQHRWMLGDAFEGIPMGSVRVGAQLTPPRAHIARQVAGSELVAEGFQAMQSFARGGLGAGWGAAVPPFADTDMEGWPIGRADLQPHYDAVSRLVGISGVADDDLARYLGPSPHLLPPAQLDSNGEYLLATYRRRAGFFHSRGLYMGHPRLAMATRRFRGRGPCRYLDMEFWADSDRAVYRPWFTLEELQRFPNFQYLSGHFAESFREDESGVILAVRTLATGQMQELKADRLILAAGAIQSARLALKSFGAAGVRVPILSNPYTYYPCLLWTRLGLATRNRRHSLTQLMMYFDPHRRPQSAIQAQVYSYRSVLTIKLLKESRLGLPSSLRLLRLLCPYFVIIGVHHPDHPGEHKHLQLDPADGRLRIEYRPSISERRRRVKLENELMMLFYRLGCWPLGQIDPGNGASIHYAGTLPMTTEERPLTTRPDGLLRGTQGVYVADGSAFPSLPSKGLTFTLMANARRVATGLLAGLSS
jgi:choline dehydrogenase-like flavoprotein